MGEELERKPGPISWLICAGAGVIVLVLSFLVIPAAELLPAHVYPEQRGSGESCVRSKEVMSHYGNIGMQVLSMLKLPEVESKGDLMGDWKKKLQETHGEKHAKTVSEEVSSALGQANVETLVKLMSTDKSRNFVYNAYALFLGLALFAGSVAIMVIGRWGAEEKTILPAKK